MAQHQVAAMLLHCAVPAVCPTVRGARHRRSPSATRRRPPPSSSSAPRCSAARAGAAPSRRLVAGRRAVPPPRRRPPPLALSLAPRRPVAASPPKRRPPCAAGPLAGDRHSLAGAPSRSRAAVLPPSCCPSPPVRWHGSRAVVVRRPAPPVPVAATGASPHRQAQAAPPPWTPPLCPAGAGRRAAYRCAAASRPRRSAAHRRPSSPLSPGHPSLSPFLLSSSSLFLSFSFSLYFPSPICSYPLKQPGPALGQQLTSGPRELQCRFPFFQEFQHITSFIFSFRIHPNSDSERSDAEGECLDAADAPPEFDYSEGQEYKVENPKTTTIPTPRTLLQLACGLIVVFCLFHLELWKTVKTSTAY